MRQRLIIFLGLVATTALADDPIAGAEILKPFKKQLQAALKSGLSEGPVNAINVCKLDAPAIAEGLSKDGIRIGRASHRLRNPANDAPEWVAPVLADYVADAAARSPRTVDLGDDRIGYVEPITTQPLCLVCHGDTLASGVAAALDELYPADQARGFAAGDLRGVFWVEYPALQADD